MFNNAEERFVQLDSNIEAGHIENLNHFDAVISTVESERNDSRRQEQKTLKSLRQFFDKVSNRVKESDSVIIEGSPQIVLGLLEKMQEQNLRQDIQVESAVSERGSFLEFRNRIVDYYS